MALTQTGENQRKIGVNLSKIIGLKDTPEKMKPLNMEREKGGYNAVGYNANGQPCGCGNGDPNGGGGSGGGGSGGGGSGGGGSGVCVCEEVGSGAVQPCCIQGFDCETGQSIKIHLDNEPPSDLCKSEMPQPTPEDPILKLAFANCLNTEPAPIFTQKSGAGSAASAFSSTALDTYMSKECPNHGGEKYTTNDSIDGVGIEYTRSCNAYPSYCSGCATVVLCEIIENENQITDEMRKYYSQNKTKHYGISSGKIKDLCNPFSDPLDEITICNSKGEEFKVKPDGSIEKVA